MQQQLENNVRARQDAMLDIARIAEIARALDAGSKAQLSVELVHRALELDATAAEWALRRRRLQ